MSKTGKFRKIDEYGYEDDDWYHSKKEKDQKKRSKTRKSDYYGYDSLYGDEYQKPGRKKQKYYL